jgi:hypothetical protein
LFCRLTENAIFAIAVDKRETRDAAAGSMESFRAGGPGHLEGIDPRRFASVVTGFSELSFCEVLSTTIPTSDGRRIARGSNSEENWSTNSVTWRLDGMVAAELRLSGITDIHGE